MFSQLLQAELNIQSITLDIQVSLIKYSEFIQTKSNHLLALLKYFKQQYFYEFF